MSRRKKSSSSGGANWMDTYGDMVTLLLCFFVLLHAMSSIDAVKWEILVKSFNPDAKNVSQIVENTPENQADNEFESNISDPPEQIKDFDDLYYALAKYVKEENLGDDIEVSKGDGFTFITFRNNIFFDGDSYALKDSGKLVLDDLCSAIAQVSNSIAEIDVLGHTSQAEPDRVNELVSDRFLSSNRATIVLCYLQEKNIVDPAKLVSSGYGQFRPISPFDTRDNRAKNRRVEILITKNDGVVRTLEDYYKEAVPVTGDNAAASIKP